MGTMRFAEHKGIWLSLNTQMLLAFLDLTRCLFLDTIAENKMYVSIKQDVKLMLSIYFEDSSKTFYFNILFSNFIPALNL